MPIISDAAPDELDSLFYLANQKLCFAWDEFVLSKNGKVIGKYNAWSFIIKAAIKSNIDWHIEVKKATYSNGFLFFSSKYQNLHESLTFTATIANTGCDDFLIRKARIKGRQPNHGFFDKITELLKEGFIDQSIYEVKFKQNQLTIVIHHKNDWFEMIDRIVSFNFSSE